MYPISNTVKALFESEQRQVLRITGTDKNGAAINITDADVVIGSFSIDRFSCIGNKLEIGTATSAQMTVKLDNYDGRFNGIVFEGTELFVEIGIADWTQRNPTINWIPCGYFTPDEQPRSLNIITIHALDRMMKFDATMPTLTPWVTQSGDVITDSQGNIIYFVSNVQFPVTVQNLVKRVALLCGVPFTQSLSNLPNYSYTLSALPTLQQEITFRNIIQWCAGIMGANAWIDWTGSLRFSWYGATTGYTSTTANRFSSDLHEDNITITGVQYTNTQNVTIVSGSAGYAIDMTGNYLAATGIAEILPNVKNVINGFSYRPFAASVINAPYLWPMDMITFVKDGVNHTCAVTNVNFGINGTTALEGKGETAQTNSGTAPSGVTKEQGFLIEQAAEVTRKLDSSLNQEGIFNRLTNNGEAQGIYIIDGQVYVNMTYARSGTLVLGGLNNQNGLLEVRDSNNNVIGTWNKDGVQINKGSINISSSSYNVKIAESYNTAVSMYLLTNGGNYEYQTYYYTNKLTFTGREYSNNFSALLEPKSLTLEADSSLSREPSISLRNTSSSSSIKMSPDAFVWTDSYGNEFLSMRPHATGFRFRESVEMYSDLTVSQSVSVTQNLSVSGTKSRSVTTDQYSDRLLYCYETPSPMFGDVGEGTIGEDGKCYIWLDPVFAQTITTTQYQVFLQRYGSGECWVSERKGSYFVVEGTPGMAFGWELKAKQRDFDQRRLERNDEPFTVPTQTYGEDAAKHIDELRKERLSA
jgi:hypothetical protein